ncbi:uncharacterized protein LOC114945137 [Nylanderia fulva]|uniref:uncharacterized protein LOC114945137 n=1 Tax=Nylanderia fulva TaxID=613905 RepID=UPI0010FBA95C|nr:uncharacterized protein LOC114945137 [Nylanderia fulva]
MALYGAPVWARVAAQQKSPPADGAARGTEDRALLPYRIRHGGAYPRGDPTTGSPGGDVLQIVPTYKGDPPGGTQGASEELDREVEVARSQGWRSLMAQWQRQLADYDHLEIVRAVQPVFDRWMDGSRGLTYEMSQILSGHGCFREYLFRIGRESAPTCRACNSAPDSVAHTLQECPAWAEERRELRAKLRVGYLTIPAIVDAIAGEGEEREKKWQAFCHFSSRVMGSKAAAERERERWRETLHIGPDALVRGVSASCRSRDPPSSFGPSSDGRAAAAPKGGNRGGWSNTGPHEGSSF